MITGSVGGLAAGCLLGSKLLIGFTLNTMTTVGLGTRHNGQQWSVCLGSSWGLGEVIIKKAEGSGPSQRT